MRYFELFEAAEIDLGTMHVDHREEGASPWYGFVFELINGGRFEIFVEVLNAAGKPAIDDAEAGVDMHIDDILVDGVGKNPDRFETHTGHGTGIQIGSKSVRLVRQLIVGEIHKTFPNVARVSGYRMTGARPRNANSNANASVGFLPNRRLTHA